MSEVCIKYSELESSVIRSKSIRREMGEYIEALTNKVVKPVSAIGGNNSNDYLSTASSLALKKIDALNSKITQFSSYEASLRNIISTSKTRDVSVSNQISRIADMYVEKRSWYEKAGDWIFNTFCVDLSNKNDLTRELMNMAKWGINKIGNSVEKVQDWFKYGEGKYVLNIALSVVATVAAVAGALIAICAIPISGGATIPLVIGCIGAIAASVGAFITISNSVAKIKGNHKALVIGNENIGAARYYGDISTQSEAWEKSDMGDASTNNTYEVAGKTIDTIKVVADTTSLACGIASLGFAKDLRYSSTHINTNVNSGKWNEGYSLTASNIKRNLLNDMGYKISTGKFDLKKAFGISDNIFEKSYIKKFTMKWDGGSWSAPKDLVTFFKGFSVIKNLNEVRQNVETLDENLRSNHSTMYEVKSIVESTTGLIGNANFFKIVDKFGTKAGTTINDLIGLDEIWRK